MRKEQPWQKLLDADGQDLEEGHSRRFGHATAVERAGADAAVVD